MEEKDKKIQGGMDLRFNGFGLRSPRKNALTIKNGTLLGLPRRKYVEWHNLHCSMV